MKLGELLAVNFNVEPIDPNGCYNQNRHGGCTSVGRKNCLHAKVDPSIQKQLQLLKGPYFICDLTGQRLDLSQFLNPPGIPRIVGIRKR